MEGKALATRVILVRHGETSFNAEGRVQGHIDVSTLTPKGMADAKRVGQALLGIPIQAFYHSPLQRARQTAQAIETVLAAENAAIAQPTVNSNLIEISLPLWEGLLFDEVKEKYPDAYQAWHKAPHLLQMDDPDGAPPFFPVQSLFAQAQRLWDEVLPAHPNQTVLLVGHSGINRSLICTALGLPPERYQTIQQANCNISILNFPDNTLGSAQLESLNITSHLGLPLPDVRKTHSAVRLLLVRHGETDWNRQGRFQGQIDVPLNANGHLQAQQAADFLSTIPLDFAITSPMKRPKETAEAILQKHPQIAILGEEPDFREISHGTWEGKFEAEIEQEFPGELERWRVTPEAVQMPEGENLQEVSERAIAAWDAIIQSARAESQNSGQTRVGLVVAHDATNKVILSHVVGAGAEKFWSFKQGNGAVSVIDYPAEGPPILQAMNITTHLGGVLDRTAAGAL
jgi:phosphoserine phosphatase